MVLVRAVITNHSSFEEWPSPPPKRASAAAECVGIANDAEEFVLWVSPHILHNVERVLAEVFGWAPDQAERYTNRLREVARRSGGAEVEPKEVSPGIRIADCPDFEDNRILELASVVDAHLIVSNDKEHLIPMSPWRGTPIITDAEFVARVGAARRAGKRRY
jgi:predicted nucleic acid-binding protein